jgi:signal transduction histidine kinase
LATEYYRIKEALCGEQALELCESFEPDLILLDVTLPGIDGFETCRELQRRHGSASPPVIFLTSRDTVEDIAMGFSAGGVDYMTKPASESETLARLRTHLFNRHLVDQLAKSNQRKNEVLGMAAHDLRNPLGSIGGLTELLLNGSFGALTPKQSKAVRTVHAESRNMLSLVNELLDVATVEAGVLHITPGLCDLTKLIERSVYLNNITAKRKETSIVFRRPVGKKLAMLDARKIRQVVDNLLSNAVKYSPLGSTIEVSVSTDDRHHVIAVLDQGPGFPEAEYHRLFKEFGTLSVQSTGGEKSTGLGLAICRRIVEAHQGEITGCNLPQGGCRFSVLLPVSSQRRDRPPPRRGPDDGAGE